MSNVVPLPSPNQRIFVIQVRPNPKAETSALKVYVDLQYQNIVIHGVSIIKNAGGGHFVAFPSNTGKNGKRFPIVECSEPERTQIVNLILDAAKDLLQ